MKAYALRFKQKMSAPEYHSSYCAGKWINKGHESVNPKLYFKRGHCISAAKCHFGKCGWSSIGIEDVEMVEFDITESGVQEISK